MIGMYSVKGAHGGFKDFVVAHLPLHVNDTLRVDLRMEVGSISETVTVEANVEQIQSDTNDVSTLINSKQITNLDINGRNESGLMLLTPGVTTANADFVLPTRMGSFSVSGAAITSNVWMMDGAEFMDRGSNGPGMVPSVDALSEFKVLTSNYGADYGFGAGRNSRDGDQDRHAGVSRRVVGVSTQ